MKIASVECLPVHSGWRKNFVLVRVETDAGVDDPEKWKPGFGKDHAQTKSQAMIPIQSKRIMV